MAEGKILVIDDEMVLRRALAVILQHAGYQVGLAANGHRGLELAAKGSFDVALVDIKLPDLDGMEVLRTLREMDEDLKVLIITGYPTSETAIQAVRLGAFDYLLKPVGTERVLISVENALAARRLAVTNKQLLHDLQHSNAELRCSNRELTMAREETEKLNTALQNTLNEVAALQGVVSTISTGWLLQGCLERSTPTPAAMTRIKKTMISTLYLSGHPFNIGLSLCHFLKYIPLE